MAEKHVEHGARAAYASWRERLGSATTWNELAPAAQITWLNVARAVLDSQQPKDDRPVWGQGADCPHRPEWHCESHGECRGCECGCDTVNPPLEASETSDTEECGPMSAEGFRGLAAMARQSLSRPTSEETQQ